MKTTQKESKSTTTSTPFLPKMPSLSVRPSKSLGRTKSFKPKRLKVTGLKKTKIN
ncbi:MAG: hypothetical protein N4A33_06575 [Bacteriovoracaceae bacterium]|nr:hypothetical protein [Bacteriovoracaceae bacterium]